MKHIRTELFQHQGKLCDIRIDLDESGYRVAAFQDGRSVPGRLFLSFDALPNASEETFLWFVDQFVAITKDYIRRWVIEGDPSI